MELDCFVSRIEFGFVFLFRIFTDQPKDKSPFQTSVSLESQSDIVKWIQNNVIINIRLNPN